MKDPEQLYRNAYFKALYGNVSLNGAVIPVYHKTVPSDTLPPFICITEVTLSRTQVAVGCTEWNCTILIDIVTKYDNNRTKASSVIEAGKRVLELADTISIPTDFSIASMELEQSQTITETDSANVIDRRLLRFRNKLFEL